VVGPLGAALLDEPFGIVDEVLESAVVEIGNEEGHLSQLRLAWAVERRDGS
jgi:hypothetical protein